MSIYVGNSEPKGIYIGTTPVKEVYVGTTKVRPIQKYKTYTVVWNEVSTPSNFFVRYEDDAAGMTQGSTDFDEFFGYSAVLLDANGNEVEEVTQTQSGGNGKLDMSKFTKALTGTANNVMIKFPRRGIKMSKSGTQVTLSITDEPDKDGFQYYAFTKGTTIKDYLYLGAYKGSFTTNNTGVTSYSANNTWLKSWATKSRTLNSSPAANQTRANFRATAAKYGNGYSLITIYPRWFPNALMMLKRGNPNSQTIIGQGYTSSNNSQSKSPGNTNSQTNASYGSTSATTQVKMFGLEDWWGNVCERVDGCYFNSSKHLTVDKTNSIFQDNVYNTDLGTASSGWLVGIKGTNDGMFMNINTSGGSGTKYYTDGTGAYSSRVVEAGGCWYQSTDTGAFRIYYEASSYVDYTIGGRLMFL